MVRNKPCTYCKKRRRRCVKPDPKAPCELCNQMKKKCAQSQTSSNSSSESESEMLVNREKEEKKLRDQVRAMEDQLGQMELAVEQHKRSTENQREWQVRFENGRLYLDSTIDSLEDLFNYGNLAIRYLSPFGKLFKTPFWTAGRESMPSYVRSAITTLGRAQLEMPTARMDEDTYCLVRSIDPKHIIPKLIDNYFNCLQGTIFILHEPSFREYFEGLKDAMEDIITLAICAVSSLSNCKHSFLNHQEKRNVGEVFYRLCKEKLLDIYDEPEHILESLVAINCMLLFNVATLRFDEVGKWSHISKRVMEFAYPEFTHYNPRKTSNMNRSERIRKAVLFRNLHFVRYAQFLFEFFFKYNYVKLVKYDIYFDCLPDESEEVHHHVELTNQILRFSFDNATIEVISHVYRTAAGDTGELKFELVLQLDQYAIEWWRKLPDHLRICDNVFDITHEMIQNTTDMSKLKIAGSCADQVISIYAYLIRFSPPKESDSVYRAIRHNLISKVLKMADISLLVLNKINMIDTECNATSISLLRICDAVITLSWAKDMHEDFSCAIQEKLKAFLDLWKTCNSPNLCVSSDHSPYSIVSIAKPKKLPPATELYKQYPLPFEAMAFDIIQTTIRNMNGQDILNPIV
ncbi:hypothetical protein BD560DRAFT_398528 [Blakeslea trispora]|nr:hypothetical protein BD560DRAFT_398528 [Blakeslea trispora]